MQKTLKIGKNNENNLLMLSKKCALILCLVHCYKTIKPFDNYKLLHNRLILLYNLPYFSDVTLLSLDNPDVYRDFYYPSRFFPPFWLDIDHPKEIDITEPDG
jgi:hypothetical protein